MSEILVIGGSGYLGCQVATILKHLFGHKVHNLDPMPCGYRISSDLYETHTIAEAQNGNYGFPTTIDRIVCCAGVANYNSPVIFGTDWDILTTTRSKKDYPGTIPAHKVVYVSSVASNLPSTSYGKIKAQGLSAAIDYGFSVIQIPNALGGIRKKDFRPKHNLPFLIAQSMKTDSTFTLHSNCQRSFITALDLGIQIERLLNSDNQQLVELIGTQYNIKNLYGILKNLNVKFIEDENLECPTDLVNLNPNLKPVKLPKFNVELEILREIQESLVKHF